MTPRQLLDILRVAERLKDTTRHCYTSGGRHESVAEHSWRMTLMAYLVESVFPRADMNKVIRMCLIHDLGECFVGDIPAFEKTAAHEAEEEAKRPEELPEEELPEELLPEEEFPEDEDFWGDDWPLEP